MTSGVLVVGAGAMGRRHAAAVRAAGDRLTVVVDADVTRAADLDAGAQPVATLEEALQLTDRFDTAIVATPSAAHLEQTTRLAEAGVPVLVEKPHRIPGQNPAALLRAVEAGAEVFVGMSTRHWPGIQAVAQVVASGALGEVLSYTDRMAFQLSAGALPAWYFDANASGGGILVTNGVHALDRAAAILGALDGVEARLTSVLPGHTVDDHAYLRFNAGSTEGVIELLWAPYEPTATGLIVVGTRGVASVEMDGSWRIVDEAGVRAGDAIDIDTEPFQRQWAAFRTGVRGFGITDLEPTLALIESLYREADGG